VYDFCKAVTSMTVTGGIIKSSVSQSSASVHVSHLELVGYNNYNHIKMKLKSPEV